MTGGVVARPASLKFRCLTEEETRAGHGEGQLYARIRYDDGSELRGWVGPREVGISKLSGLKIRIDTSRMSGLRIRMGVKLNADGAHSQPVVYWPAKHVYGKQEDIYYCGPRSAYWNALCLEAAQHAADAELYLPATRSGVLGPPASGSASGVLGLLPTSGSTSRPMSPMSPSFHTPKKQRHALCRSPATAQDAAHGCGRASSPLSPLSPMRSINMSPPQTTKACADKDAAHLPASLPFLPLSPQRSLSPSSPLSPYKAKSAASLVDKKNAIAEELDLQIGSMKSVASGAARDLGMDVAGMSVPDQINACYDALFEATEVPVYQL